MTAIAKGPLAALRHRDYAFFITAFSAGTIGSWAYNVALTVWLIQETGSPGWVAASTVGRFVPALLFSAYGGVLAERFERIRLMATVDSISTVLMTLLALLMAVGADPIWVIAVAAANSTVGTAYEPAAAAMTPLLVGERDLGAANALRNTVDNVCVIAGPGIGALMLLVGEPWLAVAVNALTYLFSAILTTAIRTRSQPVDVTEGGGAGPLRQMLVGVRAIGSSSTAAVLVTFSVIATFVFGTDTVLFVVLSRDVLGTGAEGYGYLLAGLGVGGIAAAGLVTRLEKLPRLGPVILVGMAGYCLPTLLFLVVDQPAVAFVIQVVRGGATLVVDVLAITALQQSLPNDLLGRVFGAFNALCLLAILAGSVLVPPIVDGLGLTAMIVVAGLVVPVACLAGWPWLRRMDAATAVRRAELAPKVALLEGCRLFADVSTGAVSQLAGAAEFVDVAEGDRVVTQGERADAFYVIDAGTFAPSAVNEQGVARDLEPMAAGSWFGEIGLIEAIPRTASVVATTRGRLLRVEGDAFVAALTEEAPSAAVLDGAALRLSRTSPGAQLTRAALASE